MLWDRENFYSYAERDDTDLYADVKEHDGQMWNNDVFEIFFKPADLTARVKSYLHANCAQCHVAAYGLSI